jgi:hypothetical protein
VPLNLLISCMITLDLIWIMYNIPERGYEYFITNWPLLIAPIYFSSWKKKGWKVNEDI